MSGGKSEVIDRLFTRSTATARRSVNESLGFEIVRRSRKSRNDQFEDRVNVR